MEMKRFLLLLAAFALIVAPAGCIFSPDDDKDTDIPPDTPLVPFPGTEDILMENFQLAYETMDFDMFADLLNPDYVFLLQDSTIRDFPGVGTQFSRDEEIGIARRMFAGDPVTDPDGNFVPGISTISFELFQQVDSWQASTHQDFPESMTSTFNVTFLFDRGGESTLKVQGLIKFFVSERDSVHNGLSQSYWQMRGQQDETNE